MAQIGEQIVYRGAVEFKRLVHLPDISATPGSSFSHRHVNRLRLVSLEEQSGQLQEPGDCPEPLTCVNEAKLMAARDIIDSTSRWRGTASADQMDVLVRTMPPLVEQRAPGGWKKVIVRYRDGGS